MPLARRAPSLDSRVLTLRGTRVLLDADLAVLYGVPTKALVQAVKRNAARLPADFMFQLAQNEALNLRSQFVTSSRWGGRRHLPLVDVECLRSYRTTQRTVLVARTS
jgi:hypothetical protein